MGFGLDAQDVPVRMRPKTMTLMGTTRVALCLSAMGPWRKSSGKRSWSARVVSDVKGLMKVLEAMLEQAGGDQWKEQRTWEGKGLGIEKGSDQRKGDKGVNDGVCVRKATERKEWRGEVV